MKKRGKPFCFILIALAAAFLLSGCGIFPPLSPSQIEEPAPAALELYLGSALPEGVVLAWNPETVAVDNAEIAVTEDGPSRTVTVSIRLRPQ